MFQRPRLLVSGVLHLTRPFVVGVSSCVKSSGDFAARYRAFLYCFFSLFAHQDRSGRCTKHGIRRTTSTLHSRYGNTWCGAGVVSHSSPFPPHVISGETMTITAVLCGAVPVPSALLDVLVVPKAWVLVEATAWRHPDTHAHRQGKNVVRPPV